MCEASSCRKQVLFHEMEDFYSPKIIENPGPGSLESILPDFQFFYD